MGSKTDHLKLAKGAVHPLLEEWRRGDALSLPQIAEAARPFLTAILAAELEKSVCVVLPGVRQQELFYSDLETWLEEIAPGKFQLLFFPEEESLRVEGALPDPGLEAERWDILCRLQAPQKTPIVVTTTLGMEQSLPDPKDIQKRRRTVRVGEEFSPDAWLEELAVGGYIPSAQVGEHGQLARRGGIVDVFPYNASSPCRIEFFGNRIESIRIFDPDTQTSIRTVDSFELLGEPGEAAKSTLADYFLKDTFFIESSEEDFLLRSSPFPAARSTIHEIELFALDLPSDAPMDPLIQESRRDLFLKQMREWLDQKWALQIFCNNEGEEQRLREILKEEKFSLNSILFRIGPLLRGFSFPKAQLAVITDAEIFGRYQTLRALKRQQRLARSRAERASIDFQELSQGDLVVHLEHGIGRFEGIQTLSDAAGGKGIEVLALEFANEARLYVPVEQAHLISRYVGVGKRIPALDELGGSRWEKAKIAAQKAVMDYAAQLLTLQAERETLPGHAFSPDMEWQKEFEASFLYEETPDQFRAIRETKNDMESKKPMDRLICGDVGYGKTEVAIRAAFKSVMDNRQVAVLVPTTVLAQQHFETFRQRMADYPVRVEVLSRFRSKKDQTRIVAEAREGKVDILIGTHRLLSKDVRFKELGLVVIDEEQRFGVLHKEKFKQLFKKVDVLTLSATPIPRTLYLSLVGARDMSSIETPPRNRLPIETIICPFDERIMRDAIERELARDGQVYMLHNRVGSIQSVHDRVKKLVPAAKIDVGHGQMPEDQLEEVMKRFVEGKTDVLVSTTIIESGLDIPNANTIIIDRADRFGLADLYQLRGRVGRSNQKAFAYLMLPRHQMIEAGPRKRVSAIKQYSSLGAGFKVAMSDLEIRGAGNILGTAQSGHVAAVGFDLYCKLLKKTVTRLKGGKTGWRPEVAVHLDFLALNISELASGRAPAFIPADYIRETRARLQAYRRLAEAETEEDVAVLRGELRDRFGPLPGGLENLLALAGVKALAASRGINLIEVEENKLKLRQKNNYLQIGGRFPRLATREPGERFREIRESIDKLTVASAGS